MASPKTQKRHENRGIRARWSRNSQTLAWLGESLCQLPPWEVPFETYVMPSKLVTVVADTEVMGKSQKGEWMNIGIYLMDPNGLQCIYIYIHKLICTFHQQYDIMAASGNFFQSMAIVYIDIMINNGFFLCIQFSDKPKTLNVSLSDSILK